MPRRPRALQSADILRVQANRRRDQTRHTLTIQQNKRTRNSRKGLSAIPQSTPKGQRMCLITCVFESNCRSEEIRMAFFPAQAPRKRAGQTRNDAMARRARDTCEAEATGEPVSVRLTDASAKVLSQKLYSRPVARRGKSSLMVSLPPNQSRKAPDYQFSNKGGTSFFGYPSREEKTRIE